MASQPTARHTQGFLLNDISNSLELNCIIIISIIGALSK